LDGIEKKIAPPPPCDRNIYEMTDSERSELGIDNLPGSLEEALNELVKDSVVMDALGPHVRARFIEAKRIEWDRYRVQVHPWEIEEYLTKY